MGYFDGLTDASFKKNKNGETVFYSWGVFGRGRILSDSVKADELRRFVRRYYQITLPTVVVLGLFKLWPVLAAAVLLLTGWFLVRSRTLLAGAPISDERLTIKESYASSAASHNPATLWFLCISSVLFAAFGIWLAFAGRTTKHAVVGAIVFLFFGACAAALGYMIRVRRSQSLGTSFPMPAQSGANPWKHRDPQDAAVQPPQVPAGNRVKRVNPTLLLALIGVVILALLIKVSNPHKKYSQQKFWASATLEDVRKVPQDTLKPGNKNGPVLMWAASAARDPRIITALVARGADVNEADVLFTGTPLSGAAGYNSNPAIIDELIRLGAEVNKVVGSNNKTALIIAAELNPEPKIIESLIRNGADTSYRDSTGRTALEQAIRFRNSTVVPILEANTRR